MEKNNLQHLYIPNQKLIHLLRNIRRYHLHQGKRQFATFIPKRNWYIYWNVNVSYCAPQGISLCTEKSSLLSWYYPGIFLSISVYYSIFSQHNPVFITHTTHILLRVPFSSANFCLWNLEFDYLNNLPYLNECWKLNLNRNMFHSPLLMLS